MAGTCPPVAGGPRLGGLYYEVVKVVGTATGIAGVSMARALLHYERVIRERLFPEMQPHQAYAQLRMIAGANVTSHVMPGLEPGIQAPAVESGWPGQARP
ncbi:MAG: hypothetical protein ACLPSF_13400 [Methylocella sp.]